MAQIHTVDGKLWFIHKYTTQQAYGGSEEGGWWYDARDPVEDWAPLIFTDEEEAYQKCRDLHEEEYKRREEEGANYTSVLSYQWEFYCYDVSNDQHPEQPNGRPHYE